MSARDRSGDESGRSGGVMSERAQALDALQEKAKAVLDSYDVMSVYLPVVGRKQPDWHRDAVEVIRELLALVAPPVGVSPQPDTVRALNGPLITRLYAPNAPASLAPVEPTPEPPRKAKPVPDLMAALKESLEPPTPDAQVCVWREIETAPKDGTEVLLLGPDGSIDFGRWRADRKYAAGGVWRMRQWLYVFPDAVAWSPIPPRWAPAPQGGEQ